MKLKIDQMYESKTGFSKKGPWTLHSFKSDGKFYKIWERKWNEEICRSLREGLIIEPNSCKEDEYQGKIKLDDGQHELYVKAYSRDGKEVKSDVIRIGTGGEPWEKPEQTPTPTPTNTPTPTPTATLTPTPAP